MFSKKLPILMLMFSFITEIVAAEQFVFKAGHVLPPDHPYNLGLLHMRENVLKKSAGRIRIDVFPSSQLGGERELAEACQMGTVDLALVTAPLASFDSNFFLFDIPGLFVSKSHAYKFTDGPDGQAMMDGLAKQNIKGLAFWETGFFNIFDSVRPLITPADLKGLNIRTMENIAYIEFFKALGANPVPMAMGEVFTAVQNGTVSGTLIPIATIFTTKLYTVAPYVSRTQNWYCPTPLIMSLYKWQQLPEDMQKIIQDCAWESRDYERKLLTDNEESQIAQMLKEGAKVIEVDKKIWAQNAGTDAVIKVLIPSKVNPAIVEKVRALAN
jgi:tripartite ATP-independent transporter DctP family solute receptor